MADARRQGRVGESIREVLAVRLQRGLKTPGVGFCTITGVDVTPDLRHAKVHVSVYGPPVEREQTLEGLRRAAGYLRGEVGRELRLKFTPELEFRYDESVERGARMDALLRDALAQDRAMAAQRGDQPGAEAKNPGTTSAEGAAEGEPSHAPDQQPPAGPAGTVPGNPAGR